MLNNTSTRPIEVTTIYHPDMNLAVVEGQLRATTPALGGLFDSGDLTLSIQTPTLSQMSGLIVNINRLTLSFEKIMHTVSRVRQNLDIGFDDVELEIDLAVPSAKMAYLIERYEPSAFASLIAYDVATLPA